MRNTSKSAIEADSHQVIDADQLKEIISKFDLVGLKTFLKTVDPGAFKKAVDEIDPELFETLANVFAPSLTETFLDAALDNFEKYRNATIVLKFGGEMIANENMLEDILRQAIKLKRHGCNVILVHGGGSQINDALKAQGLESNMDPITGKRICDDQVLDISFEALRKLNKFVTMKLNKMAAEMGHDIVAMGEAGYNGGLVKAKPLHSNTRTGNFTSVDKEALAAFAEMNKIPVLYTICMGPNNEPVNVNADDVAAGIAGALEASMIMVTDVPGVWDKNKKVIPELTVEQVGALIKDGTISGGMIAKVEAAISVAQKGIDVVITTPKDGGLFTELFTVKGSGTKFLSPQPEPEKSFLQKAWNRVSSSFTKPEQGIVSKFTFGLLQRSLC